MLVYGDIEVSHDAADFRDGTLAALRALAAFPPGLERHGKLVAAFLDSSALVGALIDREGKDDLRDGSVLGMEGLTALARLVVRSWFSGFSSLDDLERSIELLGRLHPTGRIRTKPAEGYAFYAVYPESYAEAASYSQLPRGTRVIGIRSIGTGLSAMVAAALDAPPPITIRPVGHPFHRQLELSPRLAAHILEGDPPAFAIVDEGPGLSGSSFGAVGDWLVGNGVPRDDLHFFPSHRNAPGTEASQTRRRQWLSAPRHVVDFDDLVLDGHLERWITDLVGSLETPMRDLSGGRWRELGDAGAPAAPQWEKRKYLARTASGVWLAKFVGLGTMGERKLELARRVHAAGFGPEIAGLRHGFLVQRWIEAPTLGHAPLPLDSLVPQLAEYLALRSSFAALPEAGADADRLIEMALYNTGQGLGQAAEAAIQRRLLPYRGAPSPGRVWIDARLHRWEWLVCEGRLIKMDAVDHAMAHDLVGAQPITWDLVGAIVEHDLPLAAAEQLVAAFQRRAGLSVDPQILDSMMCCYLAFQLGAWSMSVGRESPVTTRYHDKLSVLLGI
jgi:hypothetical protein